MTPFTFNSVSSSRRGKVAFTLIELLVVIAIIAVLAAILFPVFARARENARRTSCLSNMKQLGLAFIQYSQDYDEMIPRYQYGSGGPPNTQHNWHDAIYPYVKSVQVYNCPSARFGSPSGAGTKTFQPVSATAIKSTTGVEVLVASTSTTSTVPSYAANRNYYNRTVGGVNSTPFHTSADQLLPAIAVPAQTVLLTDYLTLATATTSGTSLDSALTGDLQTSNAANVYLHLNTTNVLFADGHAKALNQGNLTETHLVGTANIAYLFTTQDD